MTCAKSIVKARLLCLDGSYYNGENTCERPQDACPRLPGEGYAKCLGICHQRYHAEVSCIIQAMDAWKEVRGGRMTIWHDKVCDHCQGIMRLYDITWACVPCASS